MNKRVRKSQVINRMKQYNEIKGHDYYDTGMFCQNYDVWGNLRWFVNVDSPHQYERIIGTTLADCLEELEYEIDMLTG